MKYGAFLPDKGTIGFVAPSFGCKAEPYKAAFDAALLKFREMGYGTDLGENCYLDAGIGISNTPELCARELMDSYLSDRNDVIISCGGGELMCEILPYMDFERIRKGKPKWFMGYSDNTNFAFLLPTLCDMAAIYGPCAGSFGMEPWHQSIRDAMNLLTGKKKEVSGYDLFELESEKNEENPLAPYHLTEKRRLVGGDAHMRGRLLGGCLDCLSNLVGTDFDRAAEFAERYREEGVIWFLEACDLNVFSIRRALWQLSEAGWFQHAKGFLIGRPMHFEEPMMGLDRHSAVTGILHDYHVPIIMDLDIGHLPPMMPLIEGALADVTVKGNDINICMETL